MLRHTPSRHLSPPRTGSAQSGRTHAYRAWTLVELLVVLGVISVVVALILPALFSSREAARTSKCAVNLRSLVQATVAYQGSSRGSLPPMVDPPIGPNYTAQGIRSQFSPISPYIDTPMPAPLLTTGLLPYPDAPTPFAGFEILSLVSPFGCPSDPAFTPATGYGYVYTISEFTFDPVTYQADRSSFIAYSRWLESQGMWFPWWADFHFRAHNGSSPTLPHLQGASLDGSVRWVR